MSLIALLLPGRTRPTPGGEALGAPRLDARVETDTPSAAEWRFVFSRDGRSVDQEGMAPLAQLPKAERVVLVAQDEDLAWLPVRLPKTATARLKEVLAGALEDQLLEDPALTHLALSQQGLREGESSWVAALHKPWLERCLAQLNTAGLQADALVGAAEPQPSVAAHARLNGEGQVLAVVAGPHGVALWPLEWPGWRSRFSEVLPWTAEPAAAQALSDQGHAPDRLLAWGERALSAAAVGTNLLQFDLAPQMKGSRAVLAAWAAFKERRFRAVHVGLGALVVVQLIGLNASAWQARRDIRELEARAEAIVREGFPSIKVVVDPVVQAERELQAMRRASGQAGPTDLETWVDLASAVWAGQPEPLVKLQLQPQGVSMEAAHWPPELVTVLQDYAAQQGWQARLDGAVLRLTKPAAAAR